MQTSTHAAAVIVTEPLPGEPLAPRPLTTEQTEALGHVMRRLYVPVQAVADAGIGPRNGGAAAPGAATRRGTAWDHPQHFMALVARD